LTNDRVDVAVPDERSAFLRNKVPSSALWRRDNARDLSKEISGVVHDLFAPASTDA